MDIHTLRSALADQPIGHTIHYYSSVPSTMPLARGLAETSADPARISGAVVVTDEQTAGRGRLDRRWETPPGRALLVSIVVAGDHLPERPAQMPMIAGLALLDAVRSFAPPDRWADHENGTIESTSPAHLSGGEALPFRLKWPNDLVALTPAGPQKLAGLLAESVLDGKGVRFVVLGIGVNVNQRAAELPAPRPGGLPPGSLYTLCGEESSREALLIALCHALSRLLVNSQRPDARRIHADWQGALLGLGESVTVYPAQETGTPWRGRALETDFDGNLLVKNAAGQTVRISAGDVSLGT